MGYDANFVIFNRAKQILQHLELIYSDLFRKSSKGKSLAIFQDFSNFHHLLNFFFFFYKQLCTPLQSLVNYAN